MFAFCMHLMVRLVGAEGFEPTLCPYQSLIYSQLASAICIRSHIYYFLVLHLVQVIVIAIVGLWKQWDSNP
jgi:hypothetical protein